MIVFLIRVKCNKKKPVNKIKLAVVHYQNTPLNITSTLPIKT